MALQPYYNDERNDGILGEMGDFQLERGIVDHVRD